MFSSEHALYATNFIQALKHVKSPFNGVPFQLLPWQQEFVNHVYGNVDERGIRTTNYCYLEIPKKNGKTELGAAVALFHPDFQQIRIDQQEVVNICRAAGPDFPILFHVGDKRFDFSSPCRMAHLLELVPEMTAIAAHMGGYSEWEDAWKYLVGKNVYFDTSSTFSFLDPQEVKRIIAAHGVDRILWASDYPAATQKQAITDLMQLDLTPEDQEKIFHRNAEKLFGITM